MSVRGRQPIPYRPWKWTSDKRDQQTLLPQLSVLPSSYHSRYLGCRRSPLLPLLLAFLPIPPRPREGHPEPAIYARGIPYTPIPIHLHPPLPSPSTSITIPPAAIDIPQGFLVRGLPPWGAAGAHTHLPTNQPDSPPVELDTCCLSSRTQELLLELPRQHKRSSPPAVAPRCWSRLEA